MSREGIVSAASRLDLRPNVAQGSAIPKAPPEKRAIVGQALEVRLVEVELVEEQELAEEQEQVVETLSRQEPMRGKQLAELGLSPWPA